ncbi:MAG: hypothetical protein SFX72_15920 [Isosphaeraceae bacterium]|nr:hypothetical protein [Isosphaeraceae bacterium]
MRHQILLYLFLFFGSPLQDEDAFFPKKAFYPRNEFLDDLNIEIYSGHFASFKEPSLWELSKKDKQRVVYRIVWYTMLRDLDPLCIRIEKKSEQYTLRLSQHQRGNKSRYGGALVLEQSRKLTSREWAKVASLIDKSGFWTAPAEIQETRGYADGDCILIEGVKDGKHHVIERMAVLAKPSYQELARTLLEMSGSKTLAQWDQIRERDRKDPEFDKDTETADLGDQ